jgi:hypothetical protein
MHARIKLEYFRKLDPENRNRDLNYILKDHFNKKNSPEKTDPQEHQLLLFLIQQFIKLNLEIDFPDELEQLLLTIIEKELK